MKGGIERFRKICARFTAVEFDKVEPAEEENHLLPL
jgi:hypothetical protein